MYNNRGYNDRGYNGRNRSYDSGYSNRGGYGGRSAGRYNDRPSKRSGAKYGTGKNSKPYVQGWKATKGGMMKFIACPTEKGMVSEQCEQWVVNMTVGYNKPQVMTAFYNVNTKRLIIPDINFVLNPNAPNGGYCGPFYKTRNSR